MRLSFNSRCRIPADIEAVTTSGEEISARSVGADAEAVRRAWAAVEQLYRSGMHPAIQLCVRRRGGVILNRAIGHLTGNGPDDPPGAKKTLATTETPFNIFSASKAVTAMVIHLLDQKHLLHIDDPVTEYIPEFGKHGKERTTIQHVLTHRAGIPSIPAGKTGLDLLVDPARIVELLCEAEPRWTPGRRLAYHAITGGFVLGEIARRVTGKSIRSVLAGEILKPLGFRWMNYGVRAADVRRVARSYLTGPPLFPPLSTFIAHAIGLDLTEAIEKSNDKRFLTAIVPSGNVIATANELSRFYQLLLDGGELDGVRIFEPRTIRRATAEQSYLEFDFTLGIPLRYGMGFMLGMPWISPYGPDTVPAFGHVGLINIFSWADPERQVAAALMTSGKPLVYFELYHVWDILRQIGLACPKEKKRTRPAVRAA